MSKHRFVYQDDDEMEKAFNWRQFRRLFAYMKPYRKQLLPVIIVMTVLGTLTKLAIPFLISLTIDRALLGKSGRLLVIYAIVMLAMYTVQWVATGYRMRYTNVIGQQVIHDLRFHLFRHIQQLSFRFFDKRPAGSILVRVTNDVNALQDLFTNGVVNLMIDCVQLVGIVAILLFLNAKLALAIMITVPLMFVVSHSLQRRIRIAWQEVRTRQSRINAHLNESIQGIRVTQAFVQEQNNMRYFADMNASNKTRWDKAQTLNVSFGPIIEMTAAVGTFILFWYGSHLVATGAVTIGLLVAFANYIGNFWEPINRLGAMYAQLLVAMASSERIFEFLDERPHVEEKPDAINLPPIRGDIRFERVGFEYEAGRKALTEVSLEAKPGQSIAFVGHTGSGKSTIVNLLCRFYDATSGRVTIDGHDVRDVKLHSLRSQIGIVMQDTFIFSGTILDNIRYGRLDATRDEAIAAAKAVRAHDFIAKLPYGYDTEVEERGSMLSMGQRQLLSFARTMLADPRVLILDEATASIDTETESRIQEALKTLLAGRSSFIVAHRLSTIRTADMIVVLDHGVVKERGTHRELLAAQGIYAGLVHAQSRFYAS